MSLAYLDIKTTDPQWNLALEEHVFDHLPRDRTYFMLWQNDRAIIIGKHQNTLAEINASYVASNGIQVVRRLSGGGAVYHDLGNLNYTFITDAGQAEELNLQLFCQPIADVLKSLGVEARVNGRNDITIAGKKFSGNSQYIKNGRVMHHGTILFDSDLGVVQDALNVSQEKIQTKGIRSVRSRITNVREHLQAEMSLAQFREKLLTGILSAQPDTAEYSLGCADYAAIEEIRKNRYGTWEWNYGYSPACTLLQKRRVEGCGSLEAHILIEAGLISQIAFRGDFFSLLEPEELALRFVGIVPEREAYERVLLDVDLSKYFLGLKQQDFIDLMCQS